MNKEKTIQDYEKQCAEMQHSIAVLIEIIHERTSTCVERERIIAELEKEIEELKKGR